MLSGETIMDKAETYKGKPCTASQMQIGNTFFTVISVQSEHAKETAYEKVKNSFLQMRRTKNCYQKVFNGNAEMT